MSTVLPTDPSFERTTPSSEDIFKRISTLLETPPTSNIASSSSSPTIPDISRIEQDTSFQFITPQPARTRKIPSPPPPSAASSIEFITPPSTRSRTTPTTPVDVLSAIRRAQSSSSTDPSFEFTSPQTARPSSSSFASSIEFTSPQSVRSRRISVVPFDSPVKMLIRKDSIQPIVTSIAKVYKELEEIPTLFIFRYLSSSMDAAFDHTIRKINIIRLINLFEKGKSRLKAEHNKLRYTIILSELRDILLENDTTFERNQPIPHGHEIPHLITSNPLQVRDAIKTMSINTKNYRIDDFIDNKSNVGLSKIGYKTVASLYKYLYVNVFGKLMLDEVDKNLSGATQLDAISDIDAIVREVMNVTISFMSYTQESSTFQLLYRYIDDLEDIYDTLLEGDYLPYVVDPGIVDKFREKMNQYSYTKVDKGVVPIGWNLRAVEHEYSTIIIEGRRISGPMSNYVVTSTKMNGVNDTLSVVFATESKTDIKDKLYLPSGSGLMGRSVDQWSKAIKDASDNIKKVLDVVTARTKRGISDSETFSVSEKQLLKLVEETEEKDREAGVLQVFKQREATRVFIGAGTSRHALLEIINTIKGIQLFHNEQVAYGINMFMRLSKSEYQSKPIVVSSAYLRFYTNMIDLYNTFKDVTTLDGKIVPIKKTNKKQRYRSFLKNTNDTIGIATSTSCTAFGIQMRKFFMKLQGSQSDLHGCDKQQKATIEKLNVRLDALKLLKDTQQVQIKEKNTNIQKLEDINEQNKKVMITIKEDLNQQTTMVDVLIGVGDERDVAIDERDNHKKNLDEITTGFNKLKLENKQQQTAIERLGSTIKKQKDTIQEQIDAATVTGETTSDENKRLATLITKQTKTLNDTIQERDELQVIQDELNTEIGIIAIEVDAIAKEKADNDLLLAQTIDIMHEKALLASNRMDINKTLMGKYDVLIFEKDQIEAQLNTATVKIKELEAKREIIDKAVRATDLISVSDFDELVLSLKNLREEELTLKTQKILHTAEISILTKEQEKIQDGIQHQKDISRELEAQNGIALNRTMLDIRDAYSGVLGNTKNDTVLMARLDDKMDNLSNDLFSGNYDIVKVMYNIGTTNTLYQVINKLFDLDGQRQTLIKVQYNVKRNIRDVIIPRDQLPMGIQSFISTYCVVLDSNKAIAFNPTGKVVPSKSLTRLVRSIRELDMQKNMLHKDDTMSIIDAYRQLLTSSLKYTQFNALLHPDDDDDDNIVMQEENTVFKDRHIPFFMASIKRIQDDLGITFYMRSIKIEGIDSGNNVDDTLISVGKYSVSSVNKAEFNPSMASNRLLYFRIPGVDINFLLNVIVNKTISDYTMHNKVFYGSKKASNRAKKTWPFAYDTRNPHNHFEENITSALGSTQRDFIAYLIKHFPKKRL